MKADARGPRVAQVFARHATAPLPSSLCAASVDALEVSSASVSLMSPRHSGPVCFSDGRAQILDELQFSLGEGPSPDAYASRAPVFEPDLERPDTVRWPSFTPVAIELGTRGVFSFPLHAGTTCIGVLTLYQEVRGALTTDQVSDGLIVAERLAQSMLGLQAAGEPERLAGELGDAGTHRAEVHQASGMVAVQLGIDISEALVRLRAHAYASNTPVVAVAQEVVARRLRLDDDGPEAQMPEQY